MIIKIYGLSEDAFKRIKATLNKNWKKDSYVDDGLYYVRLGENVIVKAASGNDHITLDLGGTLADIGSDEFVTLKMC